MTYTVIVLLWLQALALLCRSHAQTAAQSSCSAVHQACSTCSVVATAAGVRQQLCFQCRPGYVVSSDKRTCDCAPGYYYSVSNNGAACLLCSKGNWCTGGSAQVAAISSCGQYLTTVSTGAVSQASCITRPGAAFMHGVTTAAPCPTNMYNEGSNQRNCTSCPTGMGTAAVGASTVGACAALPGWFQQSRGVILPCPQGTYKAVLSSSANCSRCPTGSTTRSIRSTSLADCAVALPGYQVVQGPSTVQAAHAAPCPVGTYSNGYTTDSCRPCPLGLTTPSTGSKSVADCSAPPGYGFTCPAGQLEGQGPVSTAMLQAQGSCMMQCPDGSFKAGWGRSACISCGINFGSMPGASSEQDCYIPAGWGSTAAGAWGDSKTLVARKCLHGTYGASQPLYGIARRYPCQRCRAHMVTSDMTPNITSLKGQAAADALAAFTITSEQQCLTLPGYGLTGGQAVRCESGSYSPGYSRQGCISCGTGMTTRHTGSTAVTDCIALQGWHMTGPGTAAQCPAGTWGAGGTGPCIPCKNWNPKKPSICKLSIQPDMYVSTFSGDYFSTYDAAYLSDYAITDEDYTAGPL